MRFIKDHLNFVVSDEFRSKVACENDIINLVCFPGQRVAIFSASFGRTQYESLQCPQPRGVKEESEYSVFTDDTLLISFYCLLIIIRVSTNN